MTEFIALPEELQARWSNVPPDLDSLKESLRPLLEWLDATAQAGDYVLVQGDVGAVYAVVRFALTRGLTPVYATTERQVVEQSLPDGTVRKHSRFHHVRFRMYKWIIHSTFCILH